ncbi:flippase [Litorilituus lipolyticus]|uniref:Flippase n=1 Tax=Litorilituus lipolyticus TaxID=2491017 RepID=A0A502KZE5_9GAMM|nr:flippase [Litorilituus lipolyticus]TPH17070.1 flippase [Litorilituus lipolyticus]
MLLSINIKNSILLILGKIVLLAIAFLTTILMARVAGPEFFGQYSYITSFSALFIPFCAMGLASITTKYFVKYPKHSHHFFLTALIIRSTGALGCIIIGSISVYLLGFSKEQIIYVVSLLALQSFTLFYVIEHYFLAKNKVTQTLLVKLVVCLIAGVAKITAIFLGAGVFTLIVIHGLEFAFIGSGFLVLYYKKKSPMNIQLKKSLSRKSTLILFDKGKWLLFSGIAAVLYLKIDQLMIAKFQGTEQVAYYAAAAKLSEFWYVFPVLIANAFNPKLIKTKQQSQERFNELLTVMLSFMFISALIISILTFYFSKPLINIIYGSNYHSSASILSIHIFATIFIFQRAILSKWLIIEGNYKFSLISHIAGAISNILLNLWLIPIYGGVGAAWATLISYIIASFISLTLTKPTRAFMIFMIRAMFMWPKHLLNGHRVAQR